jgi:murein DD-endopeptidase MepM/ murein hydrolase activator NlpD
MIDIRIPLFGAALAALTGSCIADPAPGQAQAAKQVKPAVTPVAKKTPTRIGKFALDRAPEQGGLLYGFAPAGTRRLTVDNTVVEIAPDGLFLAGFGRDYGPFVTISATLATGGTVVERLPVRKRAWRLENIKTLPKYQQPSEEFQRRRPPELAQINAARHMVTGAQGWRQTFIWPARGRFSGFFGSQRIYAGEPGSPHSGVDVAGGAGAAVVAPADGVVILAAESPFTLEGNLLMIDHGAGLSTAFLHLSRIDVHRGDVVRQGQLVGAIGMTGRATGPHLHWALRWYEQKVDPQVFAGPMPVGPLRPL